MAKRHILERIFKTGRESLSDYLPWRFWDSAHNCYCNMDDTIGWLWELAPLAFASEITIKKIDLLFQTELPEGSTIQFILFADPRIRYLLERLKTGAGEISSQRIKDLTAEWINTYTSYIDEHTFEGFDESIPVPVRTFRLFCAVKIPFENYDMAVDSLGDKKSSIESLLQNVGLCPVEGHPGVLLHFLRYVFNPAMAHKNQEWWPYNPNIEINKQVIKKGNNITWDKGLSGNLTIDGKSVGVYTACNFPDRVKYWENLYLVGDIFNRDLDQISCPFIINLTYVFENHDSELKKKAGLILTQKAFGAAKTKLENKKADFQRAIADIENNMNYAGFYLTILTFTDSGDQKNRTGSVLKGLWSQRGFDIQEEVQMSLPVLIVSMPHGLPHHKITREKLKRILIAPTNSIAELPPIQAEWQGDLEEPNMILISRRGQLQGLNLFGKNSQNYNFAIAANSGSGKSFFSGYIIMSHLRRGDYVRIIDVGRSYLLLCELLGGEYLEFSKDSTICINPFTYVKSLADDMQMILPIMEKMCKPKEGCTDHEMTLLREAITLAWGQFKGETTPSKVGEKLQEDPSNIVRCNLGRALMNYGPGGEYEKWYEGKATISQSIMFQVLELDDLSGDPHLRTLVLMFIIYQTVQLMYQGTGRDGNLSRLVVLIDEAWDLFSDQSSGAAKFISEAYRKARKYNGSIGTITQRVSDYYGSEQTKAMLSNSAHWFFLQQKPEELAQLAKDEKVRLDPFLLRYIESVKTIQGRYSEIFYKSDAGASIGRLFVDKFTYAILTTKKPERLYINNLIKSGMPIQESLRMAVETNFGRGH